MDTSRPPNEEFEREMADIKAYMPNVYQSIKDKADDIGNAPVRRLLRRAIVGKEPNCFYAFERGRVKGAPFAQTAIMADVAVNLVRFGLTHVVVWADVPADVKGGV